MSKKDEAWFKAKKFLTPFIDKYNYSTYRLYENDKVVYPKQTQDEIIRKSHSGKCIYKSINNKNWGEHFFGNVPLGFNSNPNKNIWLIMFDFDSYKNNPERNKHLQESLNIVNEFINTEIYIEESSQSRDIHGYAVINKSGYTIEEAIALINTLINFLNDKCKLVGLKCLEVMGLPNIYTYENKKIINIKNNTPAKLPRNIENINQIINTPIIFLYDVQTKLEAEKVPFNPNGGVVDCLTKMEQHASVKFEKFTGEILEDSLRTIWHKCCNTKYFQYTTPARYIDETDWVNYATTWIKTVYFSDKRQGFFRGTTPVKGMSEYFKKLTLRKYNHRAHMWTGQQLENLGILISVNRSYTVGSVARRWKIRIKALDALKRKNKGLQFKQLVQTNKQNLKIT